MTPIIKDIPRLDILNLNFPDPLRFIPFCTDNTMAQSDIPIELVLVGDISKVL